MLGCQLRMFQYRYRYWYWLFDQVLLLIQMLHTSSDPELSANCFPLNVPNSSEIRKTFLWQALLWSNGFLIIQSQARPWLCDWRIMTYSPLSEHPSPSVMQMVTFVQKSDLWFASYGFCFSGQRQCSLRTNGEINPLLHIQQLPFWLSALLVNILESMWRYITGMCRDSTGHYKTGHFFLQEFRAFELLRSGLDRSKYLLVKEAKIIAMTCTHAALKRHDLVELGFKVFWLSVTI